MELGHESRAQEALTGTRRLGLGCWPAPRLGAVSQLGALHPCSRLGALNRVLVLSRYPRGEPADRTVALRAEKEVEKKDSTTSEVRT